MAESIDDILGHIESGESELSDETLAEIHNAADAFIETGDVSLAVEFLHGNKEAVSEFCLRVVDSYGEHDRYTPALKLAKVIEALL